MEVLVEEVLGCTAKDLLVLAVQAQAHSLMDHILYQQAEVVVAEANQALLDLLVVLVVLVENMVAVEVLVLVEVMAQQEHCV